MRETVIKSGILSRFEDAAVDDSPSILSRTIFFLICAVLLFAVTAYGATDIWAVGILAIISGLIVILWTIDSLLSKEFLFNFNVLLLPLIGLIVVGGVKLVPLRSHVSADLLSVPAVSSL